MILFRIVCIFTHIKLPALLFCFGMFCTIMYFTHRTQNQFTSSWSSCLILNLICPCNVKRRSHNPLWGFDLHRIFYKNSWITNWIVMFSIFGVLKWSDCSDSFGLPFGHQVHLEGLYIILYIFIIINKNWHIFLAWSKKSIRRINQTFRSIITFFITRVITSAADDLTSSVRRSFFGKKEEEESRLEI